MAEKWQRGTLGTESSGDEDAAETYALRHGNTLLARRIGPTPSIPEMPRLEEGKARTGYAANLRRRKGRLQTVRSASDPKKFKPRPT